MSLVTPVDAKEIAAAAARLVALTGRALQRANGKTRVALAIMSQAAQLCGTLAVDLVCELSEHYQAVPMRARLACLSCGKQHIDEGEWATRSHATHRCVDDAAGRGCGFEWRVEPHCFGVA